MPATAEVEGCVPCAGLHTVIVYKLYSYQLLILIMLIGTQVATKHVLYGPICMLSLTICPGMVCRTELLADAKTLTQVVTKIACELAAAMETMERGIPNCLKTCLKKRDAYWWWKSEGRVLVVATSRTPLDRQHKNTRIASWLGIMATRSGWQGCVEVYKVIGNPQRMQQTSSHCVEDLTA
jgi:hypothetical protein